MNKIKTFKYKNNSSDNSLFNKITKRYSNVKFLRSSGGSNGASSGSNGFKSTATAATQPMSSGSYDMTGRESDDLKREIGAPILISKTTIDADDIQPIIIQNNSPDVVDSPSFCAVADSSPVHLDNIKFSFHSPNENDEDNCNGNNVYDSPISTSALQKIRSKSATNLHKSEIKVFLQRAPSLEIQSNGTHIDNSSYHQIMPAHYHQKYLKNKQQSPPTAVLSKCNNKSSQNFNLNRKPSSLDVNNSQIIFAKDQQKCDFDYDDTNDKNLFSSTRQPYHHANNNCSSFETRMTNDCSSRGLRNDIVDQYDDDFDDLKSASFQSLDAHELFLSIEELNEITKQINEADEYQHEVDLEYCEHRDKLRPDERRITLLRNKNHSVMNLDKKKEKISHAWSGLKHWIGEERDKIKDVVQKHAAAQRVGGRSMSREPSDDNSRSGRKKSVSKKDDEEDMLSTSELTNNNNSLRPSDEIIDKKEGYRNFSRGRSLKSSTSDERESLRKFSLKRKSSQRRNDVLEGQNGFEELRRYVKQGGDFGKELITILQERVDSEQLYAKSLSKMASKLNKACREIPGSIAEAWRSVAAEMESRGEVHRQFSNSMIEEIVKPLKLILDNQHKTRKAIESSVDKSARILSEWRATEAKAKKSSHTAARENEKLQDAMLDVRIQRSPSVAMLHHHAQNKSPEKEIKSAEKDCAKLDNKRRKAEELVKRADVEYYTLCIRAERARVEWEMSVLRGSSTLQSHETQRLTSLKNCVADYLKFANQMNPSLCQIVERLAPPVTACNVQKDLIVVKNIRRASEGPSEQLLPDFYCEHTTLAMNRERRKHALVKLLQLVRTDLERERKSRNGLKGISQSLSTPENQNITDKLYHIRSMLTYLEGARFKLQSALLELDHKPRGSHPLAAHIQITRDRTGLQQSILKVPLWLKNGDEADRMSDAYNREYVDLDLTTIDQQPPATNGENFVDNKNNNDASLLIKHFDRNLHRSKSSLEYNGKLPQKNDIIVLHTNVNGNGKTVTKGHTMSSSKSDSPAFDRGIADGGSNQPDSDFDEFSSQDEDEDLGKKSTAVGESSIMPRVIPVSPPMVISRCRALYSYLPKLYDELELNPGDMIDVHAKQEDGWWLGAIKTKIGIFPATYVEEIS